MNRQMTMIFDKCICPVLMFIVSTLLSFAAHASIEVTDFLGRQLVLESPAKRIIALAPHIVENIYSAGAGDKIVGAVDYCDYPEEAKKIPRVGAISAYSLETILASKPDLVVVWRSGRGGKVMEKLLDLGLTVYASDPRKIEDIPKSISDFGRLAGTESVAEIAVAQFRQKYSTLMDKYAKRETVPTFYQVWNDPLQTLNGNHVISDVIRMCGGTNVFSDEPSLAPKVSIEAVLNANPHAIVASGMGEERPDWLNSWKSWSSVKAVKCNNLYFVPPDIIQRHTARILDGAEMLCKQLDAGRKNIHRCDGG